MGSDVFVVCHGCHRGAIYVPDVGPMGDEHCLTVAGAQATKLVWRYADSQFICPWCDPVPRESFPAPREADCGYGCCVAGDIGLWSEVVSVA